MKKTKRNAVPAITQERTSSARRETLAEFYQRCEDMITEGIGGGPVSDRTRQLDHAMSRTRKQ